MTLQEIMTEQMAAIANEISEITDMEKRVDCRIKYIECIAKIIETNEIPEIGVGKDAIKSNKKKTNNKTHKKEESKTKETKKDIPPTQDELDLPEEAPVTEAVFTNENLENTGIDLKEEVSDSPSPNKTNLIIEGIDCTETYNMLPHDLDEEEHQQIAYFLSVSKEVIPVYDELIKEVPLKHSLATLRLAFDLANNSVEAMNSVLAEFSNGAMTDIYTDLNDENVEAFVDHVDVLCAE